MEILGNHIIEPSFIDRNLSEYEYINLSEECVDISCDYRNLKKCQITRQLSKVPTGWCIHTQFLNKRFLLLWIRRSDPVEWPARSPNLALVDYILWGNSTNSTNVEELRQKLYKNIR